MLGKLARSLRMLGYDVVWDGEGQPRRDAGRVLLTRDRRLARDTPGAIYVEAQYPFHQARQVIRALGLHGEQAFTRCVEDNAPLRSARFEEVEGSLPERVDPRGPLFRCDACGRTYWAGSHVERMRATILALLDAPVPDDHHAAGELGGSGRLEPLLDLHQAMDALFWAHRVAVVSGDMAGALRELRRFAQQMARHIDLEETLVLPVYRETAPADGYPRGGAPDIFRRDHEKILGDLTRLEALTEAAAAAEPGHPRDLARLALLDAERKFVDLLSHHDHRERAHLYPRLEALLAPAEQVDLLERMVPGPPDRS